MDDRKGRHELSRLRIASCCAFPIVLFAILLFVVPTFAVIYEDMGVPVPVVIALIVKTALFLRRYWILVPFLLPVCPVLDLGVYTMLRSRFGSRAAWLWLNVGEACHIACVVLLIVAVVFPLANAPLLTRIGHE